MAMQQIDSLVAGIRDNSGSPLSAGTVNTYAAGTTTPKATYSDAAGTIAASNPIVLDAFGRAQVYADGAYKLVVKTASGDTLFTADNQYFSRVTTSPMTTFVDIYGGTSSGSSGNHSITVPLTLSSYVSGQEFVFVSGHMNTGAATLNVNGLGAVSITKGPSNTALSLADMPAGQLIKVIYDAAGPRFRLSDPRPDGFVAFTPSTLLAAGGNPTGVTTSLAEYKLEGNRITFNLSQTFTVGPGSDSYLSINLPPVPAATTVYTASGIAFRGALFTGCHASYASTTSMRLYCSDGTVWTPGAAAGYNITGSYRWA